MEIDQNYPIWRTERKKKTKKKKGRKREKDEEQQHKNSNNVSGTMVQMKKSRSEENGIDELLEEIMCKNV